MAKCAACGRFLKPTGAVECGTCPCKYHKTCVGFMDVDVVEQGWSCPECKRGKPKGDNSNTPVKGLSSSLAVPISYCDVPTGSSPCVQPPPPTTLAAPRDDATEIKLMRQDLAEYMKELRDFREEFRCYRESMGQRMDGIEHRLLAVEQREAAPTIAEFAELKLSVATLTAELNERDQETLLTDLDIGHLPETAGESVGHIVTVLAAKLGVTVQERDIVFAERVGRANNSTGPDGTAEGRPRRVVVRLARRTLRDEILQAARVRRSLASTELGLAGPPRRIYINERLTKTNRQLFHRVREECRKRSWRYAWTKHGRIFVRQGDGKPVCSIRAGADMDRVFDNKKV